MTTNELNIVAQFLENAFSPFSSVAFTHHEQRTINKNRSHGAAYGSTKPESRIANIFFPIDLSFLKFFTLQSIAPLFQQELEVFIRGDTKYVLNLYGPFEIWRKNDAPNKNYYGKTGIGRNLDEAIIDSLKSEFI